MEENLDLINRRNINKKVENLKIKKLKVVSIITFTTK